MSAVHQTNSYGSYGPLQYPLPNRFTQWILKNPSFGKLKVKRQP